MVSRLREKELRLGGQREYLGKGEMVGETDVRGRQCVQVGEAMLTQVTRGSRIISYRESFVKEKKVRRFMMIEYFFASVIEKLCKND